MHRRRRLIVHPPARSRARPGRSRRRSAARWRLEAVSPPDESTLRPTRLRALRRRPSHTSLPRRERLPDAAALSRSSSTTKARGSGLKNPTSPATTTRQTVARLEGADLLPLRIRRGRWSEARARTRSPQFGQELRRAVEQPHAVGAADDPVCDRDALGQPVAGNPLSFRSCRHTARRSRRSSRRRVERNPQRIVATDASSSAVPIDPRRKARDGERFQPHAGGRQRVERERVIEIEQMCVNVPWSGIS